jgi:hypothetical protein
MSERIYCGNGKEKRFQDGGSIVTITVDIDTLLREFPNYGFTTDAGKRKIRLKVGQRREVDQYGNSHLVEVDTWKPDKAQGGTAQGQSAGRYGNGQSSATAGRRGTATADSEAFGDEPFGDNDQDIPF